MESLLVFVIGSFCISTSLPMQFVQKRAHRSTNIVLGCEVVTLTTSLPVDFVQKLFTTGLDDPVDLGPFGHRSRFLFQSQQVYQRQCYFENRKKSFHSE